MELIQETDTMPLRAFREGQIVVIQTGDGEDLASFAFDCGVRSEAECLARFAATLERFRGDALIEAVRAGKKKATNEPE